MKCLLVAKILIACLELANSLNSANVALAINCGSTSAYSSSFGFTYQPDNYYSYSSGTRYDYSYGIGLTNDDYLYSSYLIAYNNPWGYRIPISNNGKYVLVLQFAETYFSYAHYRIFTIKIGSYVVKSNLDVALEVGTYNAYDIFVEFTLSYGSVYIDGNSVSGAYSDGLLVIDLYMQSNYAMISGIVLERGDCSSANNCNAYIPNCIVYTSSPSNTCGNCIANASFINGSCSCNSAYYMSASKKCEICDKLCRICYGPNAFQCSYCASPYYMISGICLRACPYGFSSGCSSVSGAVIDTSFANYFNGTYGIFKTGSSGSSYRFFNSPENADPIPAKNRGLYFSGGTYLETTSAVYFSLNFAIGLWVWISPGSGDIFTHSNSRITIDGSGTFKVTLENHLEATLLVTAPSLSPDNNAWIYLSYVVSFSSPWTTIKTYLNSVNKNTISQSWNIYRDLLGSTIILGKNLGSNFKGFIYQFQLWNSAVSDFNTQYLDQICRTGQIANCLWSCNITSWIDNGEIFPCDTSCSLGCTRNGSCNVCYDPLCSICREFNNGLCDKCVANASGIPCSCNSGFMLSESGFSCIKCVDENSICNGNELTLNENIVYNQVLLPSEWAYYKAPFYQGHRNITLFINSDLPGPQLYINLNSDNTKPIFNPKDYYLDTFVDGVLKINLTLDSIAYANCNTELKGHYDPNKQCAYHIGIFSSSDSSFSIKFKSSPVIPKLISIGSPIVSNMTQYKHEFCSGIIDTNSPLYVKVNNLLGKASLYISFFDYELVGKDSYKWPFPYISANSYNTSKVFDEIVFEKDNLTSICPSKKCLIEICEICWTGLCNVELSLRNQTCISMQVNTYYNGVICLGCFHYYEIPFNFGHRNIKIVLMPNSTDADLYVTLNTNNKNPDMNNYDYKLQRTGTVSEEVTLTFDSVAQKNCPKSHEEASLCLYHIGVYGYGQSSYKLIYYEIDTSEILRTGLAQVKAFGSSKHGVYNSLIDSNYNASLIVDNLIAGKITINVYDYGTVKNYISSLPSYVDSKANFTVVKKSYTISMNKESLLSWCPSKACLAQICLHCPSQACSPKLQLVQDNELLIEEGQTYNDQVDEFAYKDYRIPFSNKTIIIILNIYKGDADLYISLNKYNERPSSDFYDYKESLGNSKAEVTLINDEIALSNCPQPDEPCFYHIGIFGKKASLFSIQVFNSSSFPKEIPINSLQLQKGTNATEGKFFNVMNTEKPATVSIEIISGEALLNVSLFDFVEIGRDTTSWLLPKQAKKHYKMQPEYYYEETLIETDIFNEICPSGLCIALLYVFCLTDKCEYQLEVAQELGEDQEGLLFSGNQMGLLIFFVFIGLFGAWYSRRKKQNLMNKNLENLTEALLVETKESALIEESKDSNISRE